MKNYGAYFHGFPHFDNCTAVYDAVLFELGYCHSIGIFLKDAGTLSSGSILVHLRSGSLP